MNVTEIQTKIVGQEIMSFTPVLRSMTIESFSEFETYAFCLIFATIYRVWATWSLFSPYETHREEWARASNFIISR